MANAEAPSSAAFRSQIKEHEAAFATKATQLARKGDTAEAVLLDRKAHPPLISAELILRSADGREVRRLTTRDNVPEATDGLIEFTEAPRVLQNLIRLAVNSDLVAAPAKALVSARSAHREAKTQLQRMSTEYATRSANLASRLADAVEAEKVIAMKTTAAGNGAIVPKAHPKPKTLADRVSDLLGRDVSAVS